MSVLIFAAPPSIPFEPGPPTVIVKGDQLIAIPDVMDGFESRRDSQTIVHPILGRPNPDITIRPAMLRTGTLSFVFGSETESFAAEISHAEGGVFKLESSTRDTVQMRYVPVGQITRTLERTTRDTWIVTVDFQEVEE